MHTKIHGVFIVVALIATTVAGCDKPTSKSAVQIELDNISKCFGQAVELQSKIPEKEELGEYMRRSLFIVMRQFYNKSDYQGFYRLTWDDSGKNLILRDRRKVTMMYLRGDASPDKDGKAKIEALYRFSSEGSPEHADIVIEVQTPDLWKKPETEQKKIGKLSTGQ